MNVMKKPLLLQKMSTRYVMVILEHELFEDTRN
jgi:hypothetical protein